MGARRLLATPARLSGRQGTLPRPERDRGHRHRRARTAAMNGPAASPRPALGKPPLEEMTTSLHRRTSMHVIQTAESLRKDDSFAGFLQPPWRGERRHTQCWVLGPA
jgi:hypothetical protein